MKSALKGGRGALASLSTLHLLLPGDVTIFQCHGHLLSTYCEMAGSTLGLQQ